MRSRLGRAEQAEENRRRVLEAARRVFLAKGYFAASLEMVVEEAGFTKGAVYSRFRSKADLFLALLEERITSRIAEMEEAAAAADGSLGLAAILSRQWDEKLRNDERWSLLSLEFRVHAARVPELNRRYAELHAKFRTALGRIIEREAAENGEELPMSGEDIARTQLALGTGAVLERCAEGASFPSDLMETAGQAMVLGLKQQAPARRVRKEAS